MRELYKVYIFAEASGVPSDLYSKTIRYLKNKIMHAEHKWFFYI